MKLVKITAYKFDADHALVPTVAFINPDMIAYIARYDEYCGLTLSGSADEVMVSTDTVKHLLDLSEQN